MSNITEIHSILNLQEKQSELIDLRIKATQQDPNTATKDNAVNKVVNEIFTCIISILDTLDSITRIPSNNLSDPNQIEQTNNGLDELHKNLYKAEELINKNIDMFIERENTDESIDYIENVLADLGKFYSKNIEPHHYSPERINTIPISMIEIASNPRDLLRLITAEALSEEVMHFNKSVGYSLLDRVLMRSTKYEFESLDDVRFDAYDDELQKAKNRISKFNEQVSSRANMIENDLLEWNVANNQSNKQAQKLDNYAYLAEYIEEASNLFDMEFSPDALSQIRSDETAYQEAMEYLLDKFLVSDNINSLAQGVELILVLHNLRSAYTGLVQTPRVKEILSGMKSGRNVKEYAYLKAAFNLTVRDLSQEENHKQLPGSVNLSGATFMEWNDRENNPVIAELRAELKDLGIDRALALSGSKLNEVLNKYGAICTQSGINSEMLRDAVIDPQEGNAETITDLQKNKTFKLILNIYRATIKKNTIDFKDAASLVLILARSLYVPSITKKQLKFFGILDALIRRPKS